MRLVAPKTDAWLEVGTTVDGYVVEHALRGHPGAELRYAVRAPDGTRATLITSARGYVDRRDRGRFRRLAARRMELSHPALLPVRRWGDHAGRPWLVMDPYPPRTLGDLVEAEGPLQPERLVAMLAPVADAIDLAHGRGLVHRGLGSDSLLWEGDDRLLLDAFGLLAADDSGLGIVPADVRYWSPEQVRGEPLDASSNVYSLAAVIFHALTGAPPYGGERPAVTYSHLAERPPRASERGRGLGREVDTVIEWGMAKDPLDRPASATVLLHAVAEALGVAPPSYEAEQGRARLHLIPWGLASEPRPARARRWRALRSQGEAHPTSRSGPRRAFVAVAIAAACGAVAAAILDPFGDAAPTQSGQAMDARAWERLSDRRADLRAELADADTPQDQAAVAAELAEAYRDAARPGSPPRLAAAARAAGAAYSALSGAAGAGAESAYTDASERVTAAEDRFVDALARRR
jgi:hypothetical protein